jgi:hypothetical protein
MSELLDAELDAEIADLVVAKLTRQLETAEREAKVGGR